MSSFNKLLLMGGTYNLRDIDTSNGEPMVSFTVRTWDSTGKDEDGKAKGDTSWFNCLAFGKKAELLKKYHKDGLVLWVEGRGSFRKDKENTERFSVIVSDFRFMSKNEA